MPHSFTSGPIVGSKAPFEIFAYGHVSLMRYSTSPVTATGWSPAASFTLLTSDVALFTLNSSSISCKREKSSSYSVFVPSSYAFIVHTVPRTCSVRRGTVLLVHPVKEQMSAIHVIVKCGMRIFLFRLFDFIYTTYASRCEHDTFILKRPAHDKVSVTSFCIRIKQFIFKKRKSL